MADGALQVRGECACGAAVPLDPDATWVRERVVVRGEATGTFTLAVACGECGDEEDDWIGRYPEECPGCGARQDQDAECSLWCERRYDDIKD